MALKLLKDQGYDVTAFYLKIWLEDELSFLGSCPWEEDLKFVREICERENIPLEIIPMQKEYFETVVAYTIAEVKAGRTPNPDIMCNSNVKFGMFVNKISPEFEKIASGHYAQIEEKDGVFYLKRNPDPVKDQTYFLANLSQEQLSRIMFPIGHLTKPEVRELAEKFDLPNKDRKDSQGICFLGKFKYNEFIEHYLGTRTGDIVEFETGKVLGKHEGFWYYTLGQRKGIKLGGGPWYIVKKDCEKNIVYVSAHYHEPELKRDEFQVENFNWAKREAKRSANNETHGENAEDRKECPISLPTSLQVKLRHGETIYDCKLSPEASSSSSSSPRATVTLNAQDQGIAPGQFAVFYDGDLCLGSATIS